MPGKRGISCRDYNPRIASRVPASLRNPVGHRADKSREACNWHLPDRMQRNAVHQQFNRHYLTRSVCRRAATFKRASGDRTDRPGHSETIQKLRCRKHGPANPHTLAVANYISSIRLAGPRCALYVYYIFVTARDSRRMHNWCGSRKQLERERKLRESHSFVIPDHLSKMQMVGVNAVLSNSYCFNEFQKSGAPGETRTRDPLLRS